MGQQAHKQTFQQGGANLEKIKIFRPKLGGVNSLSGEKLHDFEIICLARGVRLHLPHLLCIWAWTGAAYILKVGFAQDQNFHTAKLSFMILLFLARLSL